MNCFKVGTSCKKTTTVFMNVAHYIQTDCQGHNSDYKQKSRPGHPLTEIPGRFLCHWHYKCLIAQKCSVLSAQMRLTQFPEHLALRTQHYFSDTLAPAASSFFL